MIQTYNFVRIKIKIVQNNNWQKLAVGNNVGGNGVGDKKGKEIAFKLIHNTVM